MHYGIWEDGITSLEEALHNTVNKVGQLLHLNSNDQVLDAGCGTGGACRYIVDHFGVNDVTGITISPLQVKQARYESVDYDKVKILEMDYANTNFDDNQFDKIYSIESVCHASFL